jgi:hypothetical protein
MIEEGLVKHSPMRSIPQIKIFHLPACFPVSFLSVADRALSTFIVQVAGLPATGTASGARAWGMPSFMDFKRQQGITGGHCHE